MVSSSTLFDPSIHMNYEPPEKQFTMASLGLKGGISPVGVSSPFPLFPLEGVAELRREILSPEVIDKYTVTSKLAAFQGREFPEKVAPFVHSVWKNPALIRAVSEACGIEVVPVMDIELGHTNYQLGPLGKEGVQSSSIYPIPSPTSEDPEELERYRVLAAQENGDSGNSVVGWHNDAYPFVCVVMLSDVSQMIGGETALRCGDGSVFKARGPGAGCAIVMQGRYITHAALKAYNTSERITMVTSFRARDPLLADESVLTTIHPITKRNRLNYQWTVYRMKLLVDRFALVATALENQKRGLDEGDDEDGKGGSEIVNVQVTKEWIREQMEYLMMTESQLMD